MAVWRGAFIRFTVAVAVRHTATTGNDQSPSGLFSLLFCFPPPLFFVIIFERISHPDCDSLSLSKSAVFPSIGSQIRERGHLRLPVTLNAWSMQTAACRCLTTLTGAREIVAVWGVPRRLGASDLKRSVQGSWRGEDFAVAKQIFRFERI